MHRFQPHAATFSTKSDRMEATGFNPGPYNGRRTTRQFLEWRCYTFKNSSYIKYGRIRGLMCSFSFALAHNSRARASPLARRSPPPPPLYLSPRVLGVQCSCVDISASRTITSHNNDIHARIQECVWSDIWKQYIVLILVYVVHCRRRGLNAE